MFSYVKFASQNSNEDIKEIGVFFSRGNVIVIFCNYQTEVQAKLQRNIVGEAIDNIFFDELDRILSFCIPAICKFCPKAFD